MFYPYLGSGRRAFVFTGVLSRCLQVTQNKSLSFWGCLSAPPEQEKGRWQVVSVAWLFPSSTRGGKI